MGKRLILVLALALVVGLTFSAAYAEVQNVKVSGDIIVSGVARNHFNLNNDVAGDASIIKQNFLMTQTRVRIDADLTDNVMATVRLINERIWNGQNDSNSTNSSNSTAIDLDLAYVTLKEFLYSPLTLTLGRQEIKFGNGLIIGKSGAAAGTTNLPTDLSERRAFDAIRATLNYDPLVIDLVYAQVKQSTTVDRNTVSLAGINATYSLNKKVDLSAYYWLKKDDDHVSDTSSRPDQLSTVGALVSIAPIEDLTASLEAAYQFGKNTETNNQKRHDAWALQALANYTFSQVKMTPKIGASLTHLGGGETSATRNEGWDPMFSDQKLNNIAYAILPFSNMNVLNIQASCKLVEDVTLSAVYGYYNVAKKTSGTLLSPATYDGGSTYLSSNYTGKKHLGDALDVTATYDYTEDVQLGLTAGIFRPGSGIAANEKNATQLIGSMKVIF